MENNTSSTPGDDQSGPGPVTETKKESFFGKIHNPGFTWRDSIFTAIVLAFPVYPWFRKKMENANVYRKNLLTMCGAMALLALFVVAVASLVRDTYNPFLYFRF